MSEEVPSPPGEAEANTRGIQNRFLDSAFPRLRSGQVGLARNDKTGGIAVYTVILY